MSTVEKRQVRRKVALELLSLAVPIASAVYFSGDFVADWPRVSSIVAAGGTAAALGLYWIWHRGKFPANIAPPDPEPDRDTFEEDDEDGRWDVFTVLLLIVSMAVVIVGGIIVQFVIPLMVIVGFAIFSESADVGGVALATGWTLGVAFVLEFGVLMPMSKLWGLPFDSDPPSRKDFCPPPRQ